MSLNYRGKTELTLGILFCLVISLPTLAQSETTQNINKSPWTLQSSIQRVLQIAPEIQSAAANVEAHQGALEQAGIWNNPKISLRADNKIGLDVGNGGQKLTQFSISQSLPLFGQLTHQESIAQAKLEAAIAQNSYQQLVLEQQTAVRFHRLQFEAANYTLAKQRLLVADKLQQDGQKRAQAGDLSILESTRLDLIRESAKQLLDKVEGEYNEALNQFRVLLNLTATQPPELEPLVPVKNVPPLASLMQNIAQHPLMINSNNRVEAATASVKLAETHRLPKFTLSLYRDQDFLGGQVQDVNGIGLSFSVPLWDRKQGRLKETRAKVHQKRADSKALRRDLKGRLQLNHLHLTHLIELGEHYRAHVFQPSRRVFEMTSKAYSAGEVEILSLIDANNIYFDAQSRYLELLQEAWQEAAELRLAAGQSILFNAQDD